MISFYFVLIFLSFHVNLSSTADRWALVVTISGAKKLSDYFEWGCLTIGYSAKYVDMIVFHEENEKLKHVRCASNVKFVSLGQNGLAKLIVNQVLSARNTTGDANRQHLFQLLSDVILHFPRYLNEVKPATGSLFQDYLSSYSHWSYTDPDIVWGDISNWVDIQDTNDYDIVTVSKIFDAGRLFIRGQFALHKNEQYMNNIWRQLHQFIPEVYAQRIASAAQFIKSGKTAEEVFNEAPFYSPEGLYSDYIFTSTSVSVKIIGRAFDDYNVDPIIITRDGSMVRCISSSETDLVNCVRKNIASSKETYVNVDKLINSTHINYTMASVTLPLKTARVESLPPIKAVRAEARRHSTACYMGWLPDSARQCITKQKYDKIKALAQDAFADIRIAKLGEVFSPSYAFTNKNETRIWYANDEKISRRQVTTQAAFFHLRRWIDQLSKGFSTGWFTEGSLAGSVTEASGRAIDKIRKGTTTEQASTQVQHTPMEACMVLYMSRRSLVVFEPCSVALQRKRNEQYSSGAVANVMQQQLVSSRKKLEVGRKTSHHSRRKRKRSIREDR